MKKVLGSLLLLSLSLWARSTYEWTAQLHDKQMYLNQASVVSMQCRFDKDGKNDDVEFTPENNNRFEFELLSENRRFEGERQIISYKYLVFAKQVGEFNIELKPKMLFTTQSAIDNVIVGRDNINDLETESEIAKIKPIRVNVVKTASDITGHLKLSVKSDLKVASAYEPVHMEVRIEGEGNLQELKDLNFNIDKVQVFSDEAEKNFSLSPKGYKGTWTQRFAFVAKEDFTIPSVKISYFDLTLKEDRTLKSEPTHVIINKEGIKVEDLIDDVELPSQELDLEKYLAYVYYLLSFVLGFVIAKLVKLPRKTQKKEKGIRIKKAKTAKELLEVLILCDKSLFSAEIEILESAVYKGDTVTLSRIKKSAALKL